MPLYEYQCQKCQNQFEILQSISQSNDTPNQVKCPECGKTETEKVFSVFSSQSNQNGNSQLASNTGSGFN